MPILDGSMKERLGQVPWWQRGVLGFLLVAGLYALSVDGVLPVVVGAGVVLATLATIASVALQVRNPFEPRPKPLLTLRPVDGEETTNFAITAVRRPVDVEAVVEEALATARALAKSTGIVKLYEFAKPTQADHDKFEEALTTYADDVRAWAQESETWLRTRATAFVADVVQHNPTSVDAIDAGLHLFFPPGTVEYEETDPPEAPELPSFPRRRAGWASLMTPVYEPAPLMASPSLVLQRIDTDLDGLRFASVEAPDYEKTSDGGLEVFYGRWTIRHRESGTAGDEPFSLTLPAGDHQVPWEVRATNLPHHAKGTWTLSVQAECGTPVTTTQQLNDALQGRPEVSMDDRRAALRELLRDRHDNDRQDSDRSDSSTAAR